MRIKGGSTRMNEDWLFTHEHPTSVLDEDLDRDGMDLREWAFLKGFYGEEDSVGVDDF